MTKLPREWVPAVVQILEREPAVVRIVVAEAHGSVPREPGAFMLVGRAGVEGTIGGGRLEWESIAAARELLDEASVAGRLNKVVLGADLGQCCGGVVRVWLERFTRGDVGLLRLAAEAGARGRAVLRSTAKGARIERHLLSGDDAEAIDHESRCDASADAQAALLLRSPRESAHPQVVSSASGEVSFLERLDDRFPALWLFGAGHVGQALARILAELPLRLTWIDSRTELFPAVIPEGVRVRRDADSLATVADAPPGAYFLVMTHSHPLDYALCQAVLERNDFAWLGLIGSESKAARFRSRLRRAGVAQEVIGRMVCPIGIEGIDSKWPSAIAVGVAAQMMQQISAAPLARGPAEPPRPGRAATTADCNGENCSTCGTGPGR